jgi:hypothetical protein
VWTGLRKGREVGAARVQLSLGGEKIGCAGCAPRPPYAPPRNASRPDRMATRVSSGVQVAYGSCTSSLGSSIIRACTTRRQQVLLEPRTVCTDECKTVHTVHR